MRDFIGRRFKVGAGALAIAVFLALAGCGSDESGEDNPGGDNTGGDNTETSGLAEFNEISQLPEIPALGGPVPDGVDLVVVQCNAPTCVDTFEPIKEGAEKLGWNLKVLTYDIAAGPTALNSALEQAMEGDPDYMTWNSAFPYDTQSETAEKAEAAGIGLLPINGSMQETFLNCLSCSNEFIGAGETAMKVAQALEDEPTVGLVYQPDLASQVDELTGMQKQADAGGGSVEGIDVSAANTAPVNNNQVVGYLRTHPEINVLVTSVDFFAVGLPDALKQAGLDKQVKVIKNVMFPGFESVEQINSGQVVAGLGVELQIASYRVLDSAARDVLGEEIPADLIDPVGWQQVVTKDNADQFPASYQAEDYQQVFYEAWGVE